MIDPVQLTTDLIRCPSVTPKEAGALDLLEANLTQLGFTCTRLPFSQAGTETVDNLYARIGTTAPHICFAGHTDVVPVGDVAAWKTGPFDGTIQDGMIWGRGASDMKGAIAAFVAASERHLKSGVSLNGSISFLITGDEEGPSVNGTVKMVDWLRQRNEIIDACVVGEPTNPNEMGEMIKIGRRGSVNGILRVDGTQGHVAYPHLANNPVPMMVKLLSTLNQQALDTGTQYFQASNLEITSMDVGNETTNVIPSTATARFNIRYNDIWNRDSISQWIHDRLASADVDYHLDLFHTADCFRTETQAGSGGFVDHLSAAVEDVTGRTPELSTSGGTSDARFIKDICPVVEFGLVGQTMHKVDENTSVQSVEQLADIYHGLLTRYLSA